MKLFKDIRGSALIYSVFILFILSVLGMVTISVSMSNYKINKITGDMNVAYYLSDGAIEEALSKIKKYTLEAEKIAKEWVNDPEGYKATGDWLDFVSYLETRLLNGDILPEDARLLMEKELDREFNRKYFACLLEGEEVRVDNTLKENIIHDINIDKPKNLKGDFIDEKGAKVYPLEISSRFYIDDVGDYRIAVSIVSQGEYSGYLKKNRLELDIISPRYEYVFVNKTEKRSIYPNELIERAITTRGDLITTGGDVIIDGDIYSYGTYPEMARFRNYQMGGIISGYNGAYESDFIRYNDSLTERNIKALNLEGPGNLIINGSAITRSGLHTMDAGSKIVISGDLYCDRVIIEESSDNSEIRVGKNILMYGNLEINGFNGKITVGDSRSSEGKIIGLLDGDPGGLYQERSSSIVINGEGGYERLEANNIYIPGTSYIYVKNKDNQFYQTGESVNISKYNYVYLYSSKLPSEDYTYPQVYTSRDGTEYKMIEADTSIISNIKFKIDHFLRYFFDSEKRNEMNERDKSIVSIKNLSEDNLKDNYTLGVIIEDGTIYNPLHDESDTIRFMNEEEFIFFRTQLIREIDKKTNLLYTRDYAKNSNIEPRFLEFVNERVEVKNNLEDDENFIYINKDPNKDLFINVPIGVNPNEISSNYDLVNGNELNGIIFTRGNIFIYQGDGEVFRFNGAIVAEGNVVFYGPGSKKIKYDEDKILDLIIKHKELGELFYAEKGRELVYRGGTTINNDLKLEVMDSTKDPLTITLVTLPNHLGANKKKELKTLEIKSWKEIKN